MLEQSIKGLTDLAANDPTARPLALLQAEMLRATADPAWEASAAQLRGVPARPGRPLLHEQILLVDPEAARALIARLAAAASHVPVAGHARLREASGAGLDPLALIRASIVWDDETIARLADETGVDPPVLATLGHLAATPLLLACGRVAGAMPAGTTWEEGYCPLCGAWPVLGELRGLDRQHWLRCGRCGAGWRFRHQRCVFCANTDHLSLGYLAPEEDRESRRAVTCDRCRGYHKTVATVAPLSFPDVLRQDLATLELDLAASQHGYRRPEHPGFPPRLELLPAPREDRRWLPWR